MDDTTEETEDLRGITEDEKTRGNFKFQAEHEPHDMLKLVSLDLDGTLIHPAIFNVVADALDFGQPLQESYRHYLDGTMSLEEAFHHDYKHFVGRPIAPMRDALRTSPHWTPGIADAVQRMTAAGLRVVLTTDQPRFLAESVNDFGITDLICTEAETRHGRVTAHVTPQFEKWPHLQRHLKAWKIDPQHVAHIGNGTNDIPVFQNIGHPIAVNAHTPTVNQAAQTVIENLTNLEQIADILLHDDSTIHPDTS